MIDELRGSLIQRLEAQNAGKSVRPQSVTHVLGTLCNPCVRVGPLRYGGGGGIRTPETLTGLTVFKSANLNSWECRQLLLTAFDEISGLG
jgi:hypothetical protein